MRFLFLLVASLAGCLPSPPAPPPDPLKLDARPIPGLVVDGRIENTWDRAVEITVPLSGSPGEVKLRAAHDGSRLYLLAIWKDPKASLSRYWHYEGNLKWRKSETEDGFSVMWSPPALAGSFRERACAIACHGERHVYPGPGSGIIDVWYWGAQQCALFPQARDMWVRQGDEQRLRGDHQPENSDNVPNISTRYEGPCAFPRWRKEGDDRIVPRDSSLQEVTPEWIRKYWDEQANIGREVPLDLLRPRKGSRGDVVAAARHHDENGGTWILEMARDFTTGNPDDQALGIGSALFAVALFDDAKGSDHAVSGPIELILLPAS